MSTERGKTHLAPPGLQIPKLVPTGKTPNFVWKKKLRDLSPSKGFQFVSLSFPKVEKPRFLFFKVPEKPLKPPRINR
jgi:hypothetical protein